MIAAVHIVRISVLCAVCRACIAAASKALAVRWIDAVVAIIVHVVHAMFVHYIVVIRSIMVLLVMIIIVVCYCCVPYSLVLVAAIVRCCFMSIFVAQSFHASISRLSGGRGRTVSKFAFKILLQPLLLEIVRHLVEFVCSWSWSWSAVVRSLLLTCSLAHLLTN